MQNIIKIFQRKKNFIYLLLLCLLNCNTLITKPNNASCDNNKIEEVLHIDTVYLSPDLTVMSEKNGKDDVLFICRQIVNNTLIEDTIHSFCNTNKLASSYISYNDSIYESSFVNIDNRAYLITGSDSSLQTDNVYSTRIAFLDKIGNRIKLRGCFDKSMDYIPAVINIDELYIAEIEKQRAMDVCDWADFYNPLTIYSIDSNFNVYQKKYFRMTTYDDSLPGLVKELNKFNEIESSMSSEKKYSKEDNVYDIDGNVYSTVLIGDKIWMSDNLKTTKYNDGEGIKLGKHIDGDIDCLFDYGWYLNKKETEKEYGALYTWKAVASGKLCPTGWHVPTDNEWKQLENELGMKENELDLIGFRGDNQGTKLKSENYRFSGLRNMQGSNESGFNAILTGGYCAEGFAPAEYEGYWWTSSSNDEDYAWFRALFFDDTRVYRYHNLKSYALSVRCVKD